MNSKPAITLSPHTTYLVLEYDHSIPNPPMTVQFSSALGASISYPASKMQCGAVEFRLDAALANLDSQVALNIYSDDTELMQVRTCVISDKVYNTGCIKVKL